MEIETKYALSETDFKRISIVFAKRCADNLFKKDSYYSKFPNTKKAIAKGEPLIRIREENGKSFFTVKKKGWKGNFESNTEYETPVENIEAIKAFLEMTGYHEYFYKEKDAWSIIREVSQDKSSGDDSDKETESIYVHMELEKVNGKYYYLELEVTDNVPEDKAQAAIATIAGSFNLKEEQRDNRTWPEILGIKV